MLPLFRRKFFKGVSLKLLLSIIALLCYYFGAFAYYFAVDYDSDFEYPLKRNIIDCAISLSKQSKADCPIINSYDYDFMIKNDKKCESSEDLRLVIVIKSALKNFARRQAIRGTWGYEKRFSDVPIRRVFILGTDNDAETVASIRQESEKYGDIVLADFYDTYFNNTIKTMMAFKWIVNHCRRSKFYLFSDDDMYVSMKNVLRFIRNPVQYPEYLKTSEFPAVSNFINKGLHYELPSNVKLFSGFVMATSPHRHRCSKWFVSLDEYPYNKWPPYVSAGSYIVSNEAAVLMYYASFFTKHFRFDDIYLGLLAKKVNIEPFHSPAFNIFKKKYDVADFKYVLSSHGYHSDQMIQIWQQQKELGNA